MALVNANYEFIYADIGSNGRISDGGVWRDCSLNLKLEKQELAIPNDQLLPNSSIIAPYVFVADDAFPLKQNILKPYPHRSQTKSEIIFNYRLSRARRTVENAFGILANRFRVLLTPINLSPSKVESITLTCIVLHNFLRIKYPSEYISRTCIDQENLENGEVCPGSWRREETLGNINSTHGGRNSDAGKAVRKLMESYFMNEGKVCWQDKRAVM